MRAERLFRALGLADPALVEEALAVRARRVKWKRWAALAACLALAACAAPAEPERPERKKQHVVPQPWPGRALPCLMWGHIRRVPVRPK